MTDAKADYCPKQGGSFTAYEPQWLHPSDGWIAVPTALITDGVPYPLATGGILQTIGLCGRHQALSIAHAFAAVGDADARRVEVRIQPYRVHYDIKALVMQDETEPMP